MSEPIATYSFLPWMREGIANNIAEGDNDNSVILRAHIPVDVTVTSTKKDGSTITSPVPQSIELFGPGDVIGIDAKAIIKTEPRNWITNFETNYLPYIEFYHDDFPWRYTPAKADQGNHRLRPWITLVVLKEDEFDEGANIKDKPLPFFTMKTGKNAIDIFPSSSQLWAWAHVHSNKDLSNGAPLSGYHIDSVKAALQSQVNTDPDNVYSRIICPRKLEANTGYHAFLIPTFETGRLAGLGIDIPSNSIATIAAWDNAQTTFPYYHRSYFRTGNVGDFEYLVSLLQPKAADKRVGIRDMDVLHPGSNLPPITQPVDIKGVLKLGGALKVPYATLKPEDKAEVDKYELWDENPYPHSFETAMAKRVNLADDYADPSKDITVVNGEAGITTDGNNPDPDPVITSPMYGTWHALVKRLLLEKNGTNIPAPVNKNWMHELNLDPRFRAAAGFGTKVIQQQQEEYMNAAWEQVGDVMEANNKLRMAAIGTEVSSVFYNKHLLLLPDEKKFVFTTPVQRRIVNNGVTVYKKVQDSVVPYAATSGTFRTMTRERGRVMKKLRETAVTPPGNILVKINNGDITATPPKEVPAGVINISDVAGAVIPTGIPSWIANLLTKHKWFKYSPFILLVLLLLVVLFFFAAVTGFVVLAAVAAGLILLYRQLNKWLKELQPSQSLKEENQTPAMVDELPSSSDFKLSTPDQNFNPTSGGSDSVEAGRFKTALKDAYTFVQVKIPEPVRVKLNIAEETKTIVTTIDPRITIAKRLADAIKIPGRIKNGMTETFTPVMAYPELNIPMYKPLADLSSELFLPNINLVEQNSVTLLETNRKFIESYMVGVNHEMARELLWREYPTDQRGSYFRQFWDVSNFLAPQSNETEEQLREKLRDITPIHLWAKKPSNEKPEQHILGKHNKRAESGQQENLVLVVRGELLKRYPTAVIYAHKADWGKKSDGTKDVNEERDFIELTQQERDDPGAANTKIKTPLFEAKVDPDVYFFGFDLTATQAQGKVNPTSTSDDAGWFFVIKERPGEPRFGLDQNKAPKIINWNNLSWQDIGTVDGQCIQLNKTISFDSYDAGTDQENKPDTEDTQSRWSPDTNAAELAYILYQVPVLVGVHASRMLPK